MRKLCLAGLIAMSAFVMAAPAAQATTAADPVRRFDIRVGNTYTVGTVTYHNRSVTVAGEHKAVNGSGCRSTEATAYTLPGRQLGFGDSPTVCQGSVKFSFNVPADIRGGAGRVLVEFKYEYPGDQGSYTLDFQDTIR